MRETRRLVGVPTRSAAVLIIRSSVSGMCSIPSKCKSGSLKRSNSVCSSAAYRARLAATDFKTIVLNIFWSISASRLT